MRVSRLSMKLCHHVINSTTGGSTQRGGKFKTSSREVAWMMKWRLSAVYSSTWSNVGVWEEECKDCFTSDSYCRLFPAPHSEMSRQTATALPTGTSKCPPSQRVPTLSGTTASNSDLASLFECPVCFDYVLPPILQCQSGHLVCNILPKDVTYHSDLR